MRVNRDTLLKIASDTITQRTRANREIVSAYLAGSLLGDDYLLGGATDIDLVFIHSTRPTVDREIIRLSDDVHLDIAHRSVQEYRQPRSLRVHPWLGPAIYKSPILPADTQHWFEFTQASVRSQFTRPDYTLERARAFYDQAYKAWQQMPVEPTDDPGELMKYLDALANAGNAAASLNGDPLTERRFLLAFPARAESLHHSGLSAGLAGLLGSNQVDAAGMATLLPVWEAAFSAAGKEPAAPKRLQAARLGYYRRGAEELIKAGHLAAALWPVLRTWTLAACVLPAGSEERRAWLGVVTQLQLAGEHFVQKHAALEMFMDSIDEALEEWGKRNGIA